MVNLTDVDATLETGQDILLDEVTEEFYQDPLENFSKMFILDIDTVPKLYKSRYTTLYNFLNSYNRSLIVGGSVWMKKTNKLYDIDSLKKVVFASNSNANLVDFAPDIDIFTSETPLNLKMIFQHDLMRYLIERYLKNHSRVFQESSYFKENKADCLLGLTDNFDNGFEEPGMKITQNPLNNLYEEGSSSNNLFSMGVFMIQTLFFKLNIITTMINESGDFYSFTQHEINQVQKASHILKIMLDFDFFGAGLVYNPKTKNISHVNALFLKGFLYFKNTRTLESIDRLSSEDDALERRYNEVIVIHNYDLMNKLIKSSVINSSLNTPKLIEIFRSKDNFSSLRTQPSVSGEKIFEELIKSYEEFDYNKITLSYNTMSNLLFILKYVSDVKTIFRLNEKYLKDPEFKDLTEELVHKKINNLLNQISNSVALRRIPRVLKYRLTKYLNRGYEFDDTHGIISIINAFEKILNWTPKKIKRIEIKETLNKEYGVTVLKEIDDIFNGL